MSSEITNARLLKCWGDAIVMRAKELLRLFFKVWFLKIVTKLSLWIYESAMIV